MLALGVSGKLNFGKTVILLLNRTMDWENIEDLWEQKRRFG